MAYSKRKKNSILLSAAVIVIVALTLSYLHDHSTEEAKASTPVTETSVSQSQTATTQTSAPQSEEEEVAEAGGIELPSGGKGQTITHTGYTLSFNETTNCPEWVAWSLTKKEVTTRQTGRSDEFFGDPDVAESHRVESYDYKGTGYDRGHMCPAADMKWSPKAMTACFYMSNICPQTKQLNQQWWEHLETACRRWAKSEGEIYICCGPIFKGGSHKTIGRNVKVQVPEQFFKVILSLRKGKEKAIGFIYTNDNAHQEMEEACMSVDEVESATGMNFFPKVDAKLQKDIEAKCDLRSWN